MKSILKAFAVAVTLIALAACNHKAEFTTDSFVRFDVTSLSFDEDAGSATLAVKVYPRDGFPDTHVYFEWAPATDGNRNSVQAEYGTDYTVSPSAGVLDFYNDSTQYITIYPVQYEDEVTGDRCFTITLTGADNGYSLTATNKVLVKILDLESDENWVSLGMCTYTDDYMAGYYYGIEEACFSYKVEIEEEQGVTEGGWFRLVNPYGEAYPLHNEESWNKFWTWISEYYYGYNFNIWPWEGKPYDDSQDYYMYIDATDPDRVFIELQNTGMDYGDGWIYVYSFASYYMDYGYTADEIAEEGGIFGTYKNGVITFPDEALLIYEPGYSSYLYYANNFGKFKVVLPGTDPGDFSVDIAYTGRFTNADDENFIVATVDLQGKDIEYAHVAYSSGRDGDSLVDAIKSGSVDCVEITESGEVLFPCEESGNYTIAVVTYDDSGDAQDSAYVTFKFSVGGGESWSLYGTGTYYFSGFYWEGSADALELYQNTASPNEFMIKDWNEGIDFYFTCDQSTNEIYVEDQFIGETYGYYGDVNICDLSDDTDVTEDIYYGTNGYHDDGIFYFAVEYYCSGGYFGFGYECFALDAASHATIDEITGTYNVWEYDAYYGTAWNADYVLASSNNQTSGNVMFTKFDDESCTVGNIYGTYDEDTGILEFEGGQIFCTWSSYYCAPQLYSLNDYGYPVTFRFFKNGDFWGPYFGDYMEISAYTVSRGPGSSGYTYQGGLDEYLYLLGSQDSTRFPSSVKANSVKESVNGPVTGMHSKTIDHQPIPAVKKTTSSYNFVPTKEVKAKVIENYQIKGMARETSLEMN